MKKCKKLFVVFVGLALAGCQNPFLQIGKDAASSTAHSPFTVSPHEDSEDSVYTVSFVANGGSPVPKITNVAPGSAISEPESNLEYFILEGWYKDISLDDPWDFSFDKVNSNITLYAKWEFDVDAQGDGESEETPYLVYNITTLWEVGRGTTINGHVWSYDKHYKQVKDIDMAGQSWGPISTFTGSYNGNGKIISNLECIWPDTMQAGFISYLSGTIKNLGMVNANIVGNNTSVVGGFAAHSSGTVQGCFFTGSVIGKNTVGGITGTNSGLVENCYVNGDISTTDPGSAWVDYRFVGGVAGHNDHGMIQNCYTLGNVSGSGFVGGIVGRLGGAELKNCVALNTLVKALMAPIGRVHGGELVTDDPSETINCFASVYLTLDCGFAFIPIPDRNGEDVEYEDYSEETWWTGTAGWDFATVWAWDAARQLPVLR